MDIKATVPRTEESQSSPINPALQGNHLGIRRFGANSAIYFFSALFTRGINFLLIPVFTRLLTTDDYGILAIAVTGTGLLSLLMSLTLESMITQMAVRYPALDEQRSLLGTLLIFWLFFSGLLAAGLEIMGRAGYLGLFPDVPFVPYLELVVWTSFFTIFVTAAQTLFMTREKPVIVAVLSAGLSLMTVILGLIFVLGFHQGALGCLRAAFFSALMTGITSFILILRQSNLRFCSSQIYASLRFSLPLIPHSFAIWGLNLSDRFVLERFVSTAQIGVYSLGYQIGSIVSLMANSMNNAFFPMANTLMTAGNNLDKLKRLASLLVASLAFVCLCMALLGPELVRLATPGHYHGAAIIVPWISFGFFFQGIYFILSRGIWFSMRTGWMPLITGISAGVSVTANFLLIPVFGIVGSGIANTLAFATLAILSGVTAARIYPIDWHYRDWLKIGGAGGACYLAAILANPLSPLMACCWKLAIIFLLFPVLLIRCKIIHRNEIRELYGLLRRKRPLC